MIISNVFVFSHAKEMLRILKQEYTAAMNVEVDGRVIQPAKCLSW